MNRTRNKISKEEIFSKDWIEYFFNLAKTVAHKSKDPSTKVGCVIVGEDKEIRSTGYNGFPRGVKEYSWRYNTREEKLHWTEHAERNAIYNAARVGIPLKNCSIFIWGLPPCNECAKAILQSGIKNVYYCVSEEKLTEERKKMLENYTKHIFNEGGVNLYCIDYQ